ncbi:MAG: GNAT family N-acetyltransferase [Sphingomicrobium sp.]
MSKEPQVRHNRDAHRFEVDLGNATALAAYSLHEGEIVFTHTEVPAEHEGHGIGTLLIKAGLDYARSKGLQVIPSCPFFAAYMKKHVEVQDLLDPYDRKQLGIES